MRRAAALVLVAAAAARFSSGLPCRADVLDVEDEGDSSLALSRLRPGPGGCQAGVRARVRFVIRDAQIAESASFPSHRPSLSTRSPESLRPLG